MKTILVVEDDADSRAFVEILLSHRGYAPIGACNGQEALTTAEHSNPSLILLDLMMPGMDGYQFLRAKRQHPTLSNVPVVVLSGVPNPAAVVGEHGVVSCLRKPIEFESLLAAIEAHCGHA
jgi:CheY-like chemotaxis protein